MTIDEAIAHAREVAEKNYLQGMLCHANPNDEELDCCIECGREHEQLAEWLEELKKYQAHGTPDGYGAALKAYDDCYFEKEEISNELQEYRQLGALEEVRDAVEKQKAKKPIYRHYENAGEPPYIKIACPNGCRIQLHPVTDKHLAHEHDYCPKCGQHIDWSEEE